MYKTVCTKPWLMHMVLCMQTHVQKTDSTSSYPQNEMPLSLPFPLFYSARREVVTYRLHHIESLSFRTEILLDLLLANKYSPT